MILARFAGPRIVLQQDPDDLLPATIDWSEFLGAETLTSSQWTAEEGVTISSPTRDDTTTTVWISGGTIGQTFKITNSIVTSGAREKDFSFNVRMTTH
jgi:hypothetical protein